MPVYCLLEQNFPYNFEYQLLINCLIVLIYKATKYLRIKGALDFIELQMLRRVDFM